jgi:hypothetical protein
MNTINVTNVKIAVIMVGMADHPTTEPTDHPDHGHRSAPTTPAKVGGRFVTWLAFWLGVVGSVAANVAHTSVASDKAMAKWVAEGRSPEEWSPPLGAMLFAGAAPLFLMLAIEMIARVPWPTGRRWTVGRWVGCGMVGAVAAVVSYQHMHGLLLSYGETKVTALILPLAPDGLMVVASLALIALSQAKRSARADRTRAAEPTTTSADQPTAQPTTLPAARLVAPTVPADRPAVDPPTAPRAVKATKRAAKNGRKATTREVRWTPTVIADVQTLHDRYGATGPASQRQIRADLKWHPEKATNAWWAFHSQNGRSPDHPTDGGESADDTKEESRELVNVGA